MDTVGKKLKFFREAQNYTQEHIAEQLGKTQKTYSRIENGNNPPSLNDIEKLAEIYKMDIIDFLKCLYATELLVSNNQLGIGISTNGTNIHNGIVEKEREVYERTIHEKNQEIQFLRDLLF